MPCWLDHFVWFPAYNVTSPVVDFLSVCALNYLSQHTHPDPVVYISVFHMLIMLCIAFIRRCSSPYAVHSVRSEISTVDICSMNPDFLPLSVRICPSILCGRHTPEISSSAPIEQITCVLITVRSQCGKCSSTIVIEYPWALIFISCRKRQPIRPSSSVLYLKKSLLYDASLYFHCLKVWR